jgi:hypothetical protein
MHDSLAGFPGWLRTAWGGFGRTRLLSCEGYERRQGILIARAHQRSTPVRKFFFNPRATRIEPGQWGLLAPVQPGTDIKFAMFRRKP